MSKTIKDTANELLKTHDDLVQVLGQAYDQDLVQADDNKHIKKDNQINNNSTLFGG